MQYFNCLVVKKSETKEVNSNEPAKQHRNRVDRSESRVIKGQESVWDYPRPPRIEACPDTRIRIVVDGLMIVDTYCALRVLETSHPPVYYIPVEQIRNATLQETLHRTWCEWKGTAHYFSLVLPQRTIKDAGWFYPQPSPSFAQLVRTVAFYPSKVEACFVDDDCVTPQEGDFYGGWITPKIAGPFKGGPGTMGW